MEARLKNMVVSSAENQIETQAKNAILTKAENMMTSGGGVNISGEAAAIGLGVVVAGVAVYETGLFFSKKYHEHASAAHKKELEEYAKVLKRFDIPEPNDPTQKIPFSTVFRKKTVKDSKNNDVTTYESDHYTQQEMATWINHRPASDADFLKCNELIDKTMTVVLTCYEKRLDKAAKRVEKFLNIEDPETDVTSADLRDLLKKLTDVKKADGFERKKAMLIACDLAISDFYEGHPFREEWLNATGPYLQEAIRDLTEREKHLSLDQLINESWPDANVSARNLLEIITFLVTPQKDWLHIVDENGKSNFDEDLIAKGFIHLGADSYSLGVDSSDKELTPSPFASNLMKVAKLFSELKPNERNTDKGNIAENHDEKESFIKHPDFNNPQDREAILQFFINVDNFITSISIRPNPKKSNGKTVPLYDLYRAAEKKLKNARDNNEKAAAAKEIKYYATIIQARVDFLCHLTTLAGEATTNVGLQLGLSQCAKDRGEKFISNPKHATFIFGTANELGNQLCKRDNYLQARLDDIKLDHAKHGLTSTQKNLWNRLAEQLAQLNRLTTDSMSKLSKHRSKLSFIHVQEDIARDEHWAIGLARDAIKLNKLPTLHTKTQYVVAPARDPRPPVLTNSEDSQFNEIEESKNLPSDEFDNESNDDTDAKPAPNTTKSVEKSKSSSPSQDAPPPIKNITDLKNILLNLNNKVNELAKSDEEKSQPEKIQSYRNIYAKLDAIRAKSENLINEKTANRYEKAVKLIQDASRLSEATLTFFNKNSATRASNAHDFVNDRLAEISKENKGTAYVDTAKNLWGKLFGTKTRAKLNDLEQAYIQMMTHP